MNEIANTPSSRPAWKCAHVIALTRASLAFIFLRRYCARVPQGRAALAKIPRAHAHAAVLEASRRSPRAESTCSVDQLITTLSSTRGDRAGIRGNLRGLAWPQAQPIHSRSLQPRMLNNCGTPRPRRAYTRGNPEPTDIGERDDLIWANPQPTRWRRRCAGVVTNGAFPHPTSRG